MLTDLTNLAILLESLRRSNFKRREELEEAEILVIQLEGELKETLMSLGFEQVDASNAREVVAALIESGYAR